MKNGLWLLALMMSAGGWSLEPIQSVTLGPQREFIVNGRPFFPIMLWLQDPQNFPYLHEIGANTIAGYWPKSGGTADVVEYMERVEKAGLYGVMPFDERLKGHPWLLGYIHDDEPDLPHKESEAQIEPGPGLRLNPQTPLWRIVDGDTNSWSVLDPLAGASVTIRLKEPVTLTRLGLWLTISPGLAVAKKITILGDGQTLTQAELRNVRGRQEIALPAPTRLQELTIRVDETYPGAQIWGSIAEIEGFDAAGENRLLSPPREVVRQMPEETQRVYQRIRAADPSRPVFMTLTANFMPFFKRFGEAERTLLYEKYVQAADVLGFDVYPIYGWGRPDWIHLVSEGTAQLRQLAPHKPLYAWIETSKGSQWVGEANQKEVTPAHIRAEVWMAICQGATAIGYFTHIWKPQYKQFGVPPANVAALREINDQLTRLTPILAAPAATRPVRLEFEGGLRAKDMLAKEYEEQLYIFAVNSDPKSQAARGTIYVGDLEADTPVEVVDEGRVLRSVAGAFVDDFAPLAVHIYRLPKGR